MSFTTNTALAQTNLNTSPAATNISAQTGSTQRVKITLQNPSNKPITVKVLARDFEAGSDQNGETQLLSSNVSPYSLANWLSDSNLNKQLTVPANQLIDYEAVFRVPLAILPKTHFGSVVFMQDTNILASSLVFITVGRPETAYVIEDLTFSDSDDATRPHGIFTVTVANTSEALVTPSFQLKITGQSGMFVTTAESTDQGSVLPGAKRKYILSPSAQMPNELLTATVTATDKTGKTSDRSIQLDRLPTRTSQNMEEHINPNDYAWIPPAVVISVVLGITLAYLIIQNRLQTKNTPV